MRRIVEVLAVLAVARAATVTPPTTKIPYRLPTSIVPENYTLYLVPYLDNEGNKTFTFEGNVTIRFSVSEPTSIIQLHSNELKIFEASTQVTSVHNGNTVIRVIRHSSDSFHQFLMITLDQELKKNLRYDLALSFTGVLNDQMKGFYRSSYLQGNETKWIATTQFEPVHARSAFPCFDEPRWKATFKINVARKEEMNTLCNMPLDSTSELDDTIGGRVWDTFQETPIMATYLTAFVVSDFESQTNNGFVTIWARKNSIHQGAYALEVGQTALLAFENFLGLPYSLPNLDIVGIPDFSAGAMENWGLITFREADLLHDPIESTTNNKQRVTLVVSHELAHMWFGDLITMDWWSDTWLNEGFAAYMEHVITDILHPEWNMMDQFLVKITQPILDSDSFISSEPLIKPCESPDEIERMFKGTTYDKGASLLRMLDHILSRQTFQKSLHNYLSEHQYSSVTPAMLYKSLGDQASNDGVLEDGITIDEIMKTWTEKPGFPVITVKRSRDNPNKTVISQARFVFVGEPTEDTLWWIPLTWTKKSDIGNKAFEDTKPAAWIRGVKEATFDIPVGNDEWIIFNNQQTGFYRVAYDADVAWPLIVKALHSPDFKNIHPLNRAQIINDAVSLARGGIGTYENVLEATLYYKNEVEYIPWMAAFEFFGFLDTMLNSHANYPSFKMYVLQLLEKVYKNVTFNETPNEHQTTTFNRMNVLTWSCESGNEDCIKYAKEEFRNMVELNVKVSPNKKRIVYCTALKHGTAEDWNFMWKKYLESDLSSDKVLILSVLGCSKDPKLMNDYLMKSIDPKSGIRKQDTSEVFSSVQNGYEGINIALDFLIRNYDNITAFYVSSNEIDFAIQSVAAKLTTKDQVDKLIKFIDDHKNDTNQIVAHSGKSALDISRTNLAWTEKHAERIMRWMKEKIGTGDASAVSPRFTVLLGTAILSLWFKFTFQTSG